MYKTASPTIFTTQAPRPEMTSRQVNSNVRTSTGWWGELSRAIREGHQVDKAERALQQDHVVAGPHVLQLHFRAAQERSQVTPPGGDISLVDEEFFVVVSVV